MTSKRRTVVPVKAADLAQAMELIRRWDARAGAVGANHETLWTELQGDLSRSESEASAEGLLQHFALLLCALRMVGVHGARRDARDVLRLQNAADEMAQLLGLHNRRASTWTLLCLYHDTQAHLACRRAAFFEAAWNEGVMLQVAPSLAEAGDESHYLLMLARTAERMGRSRLAVEALDAAMQNDRIEPQMRSQAQLAKARLYRLSGDQVEARKILDAGQGRDEWGDESKFELHWESLCQAATWNRDVRPMVFFVRGEPKAAGLYRTLQFLLWIRCAKDREWLHRSFRVETVRRKFPGALRDQPALQCLTEACEAIENFYDTTIPIDRRCADVSETLARLPQLPTIEDELLVLGAVTRAFARHRQHSLAAMTAADYCGHSLRISSGRTEDALGLLSDVADRSWLGVASGVEEEPESEGPPTSTFARTMALSRTTGALVSNYAASRMRLLFAASSEKDRVRRLQQEKTAMILYESLGRLKGLAMKAGQTSSFCQPILPPAVRAILDLLHVSAVPVDVATVRSVIHGELHKTPEEMFERWDETPLAAGSIGQVHRAWMDSDKAVVVKVQYPHVQEILRRDCDALRFLRPFLATQFPKADLDSIRAEIIELLMGECDYEREASHQTEFKKLNAHNPRIRVPAVVPSHSGKRVLTMEYLEGQDFNTFSETATQEERNRIGEELFRFVYRPIMVAGVFYGDPHPGNLLIDAEGRLCVLDYGCVKHVPDRSRLLFRQMHLAVIQQNQALLQTSLEQLGHVRDPKSFDFKAELESLSNYLMRPFIRDEVFRYEPDFVAELARMSLIDSPNRKSGSLARELLLSGRLIWGLSFLLAMLRAENNWYRVMQEIFQEGRAETAETAEDVERRRRR